MRIAGFTVRVNYVVRKSSGGFQRRILVADHEQRTRDIFIRKLAAAGYTAVAADSGRAALQQLRTARFDLFILNLDMPDLEGFDLLKIVRKEMPHVRVLVISGYMQGQLLEAANWFGVASTLKKTKAVRLLVPMTRKLLGEAA
jgi:CheY-like chemotaxis protein